MNVLSSLNHNYGVVYPGESYNVMISSEKDIFKAVPNCGCVKAVTNQKRNLSVRLEAPQFPFHLVKTGSVNLDKSIEVTFTDGTSETVKVRATLIKNKPQSNVERSSDSLQETN